MAQEIIRVVFRYLHIIGATAAAGGLLAEMSRTPKRVSSLVLHGAATQLLTGIALLFLTLADADHLKITVKFVLLVALLILLILQRRRGDLTRAAYALDLSLTLLIIAVAVFWRSYSG